MAKSKIKVTFNPDTMTVSDLKQCANTLRELLLQHNENGDDWGKTGIAVAQFADAFEV